MPRCLRCKAGSEWIEGDVKKEALSNDLLNFLRAEIQIVKSQRQSEIIAGNIVKEALWQGEWTAYRNLVGFLHTRCGDDTYAELLKEI